MFSKLTEALARRERELTTDRLALRIEQHNTEKETTMQYDTSFIQNRATPTPLEGYVTNFTKNGAAFVREFDGTRDIFVPVAIVERTGINRGDRVFAMAVPNKLYESWTPELGVMRPAELFAIHLMDSKEYDQMTEQAQSDEVIEEPTLEDLILKALDSGPATAGKILRTIGDDSLETRHIFDALSSMHRDGEVAKASIKQRADQKNASYVVWAHDRKELIPPKADDQELEF
jgi:hypothetical protein